MTNSSLTKYFTLLDNFFFMPVSNKILAFFRIAVAIFCIFQIGSLYPDLLNLFGEQGFVRREILEVLLEDYMPRIHWLSDQLILIGISEVETIFGLFYAYILVLGLMAIGFKTRCFSILAWFIHLLFFGSGDIFMYGADYVTTSCLFYCMLMPVGNHFSLDNLLKKKQLNAKLNTVFPIRLLQFHLCLIYFFGGTSKMIGVHWWNGEGIWRAMMLPDFYQFDMSWLANYPMVLIVMGWTVLLFEVGYPFFIFYRKTRAIWLFGIIGMHIGIGLFMGLYQFAAIMIIMNITAFGSEYFEKWSCFFSELSSNFYYKKQMAA